MISPPRPNPAAALEAPRVRAPAPAALALLTDCPNHVVRFAHGTDVVSRPTRGPFDRGAVEIVRRLATLLIDAYCTG